MNQKLLNKFAKQYSKLQLEDEDMPPKEHKQLAMLIESDFKSGFLTAMHMVNEASGRDMEKMKMLKVVLDQHFSGDLVNLEEVGRAVGISFGYL